MSDRRASHPHRVHPHELRPDTPRRRAGLLDVLSLTQVDRLVTLGARRGHFRGDVLLQAGDGGERVLVLLAGQAKRLAAVRGRNVLLSVEAAGALLSDVTILDGDPEAATVVALTDGETLALGRREFAMFLAADARAASALARQQAQRMRELERRRLELLTHAAPARLAARLVELAERFGQLRDGAIELELDLSQDELGGWITASNRATATAMQNLRELGLVATSRRKVRVLDLDGLRSAAR